MKKYLKYFSLIALMLLVATPAVAAEFNMEEGIADFFNEMGFIFFFQGEGVIVLTPFDRGVEDRQKVIEYIRNGKFNPAQFLKTVCKPEDMPENYRKLQKKEIISLICDWQ